MFCLFQHLCKINHTITNVSQGTVTRRDDLTLCELYGQTSYYEEFATLVYYLEESKQGETVADWKHTQ